MSENFDSHRAQAPRACLRFEVTGTVQGVGFRPFVFRLARRLGIRGWVANSRAGVVIHAEGSRERLATLAEQLVKPSIPGAAVRSVEQSSTRPAHHESFEILSSRAQGAGDAGWLPDRAVCAECREELFDSSNRRFRYPFLGCTACGPRYSVTERGPFDRENTTMSGFPMCDECAREFVNPADRRFHSQLNCCSSCGPQVELWANDGAPLATGDHALAGAVSALRNGEIVAVKGIGGYHLMTDARNAGALARLRSRKNRARKPFALMFPTMCSIEAHCDVDAVSRTALESAAAPIVLLPMRPGAGEIFHGVAPGLNIVGVMLPYTPLHLLLLVVFAHPVVATSANLTSEPICTDEREAVGRLGEIADRFLVHDRPIARAIDDSVVRSARGRRLVLRRARGIAPEPLRTHAMPAALALGAHWKATVALGTPSGIRVSEHLGDLESIASRDRHQRAAQRLSRDHCKPVAIVRDLHPDNASDRFAARLGLPTVAVQHHYAHALACMVDNQLAPPLLAVVWDGAGAGFDGAIWGGEFLIIGERSFERFAHLREFGLPGGSKAMLEPRRAALSVLWETFGGAYVGAGEGAWASAFTGTELSVLTTMLERGINAPSTSSAGRLFDAVSALLGLCSHNDYEGEAAMALECAVKPGPVRAYPFVLRGGGPMIVDWTPAVRSIVEDLGVGAPGTISARFHRTLAAMVTAVAQQAGLSRVVLTGGCFQNAILLEDCARELEAVGVGAYSHRELPPNDGGIAPGQIVAASRDVL